MKLKVKKLGENAILPTRGSSSAAGWDLYSAESVDIKSGETTMIHTGIAIEIPEGYFGAIYARSGLATKQGLRPANCVGVIDSDYRGEIIVALHSDATDFAIVQEQNLISLRVTAKIVADPQSAKHVEMGERVAQLVIQKYEDIELEEVDELDSTERGEGGFGSTGTK